MDLTYTNAQGIDQGVFTSYELDLSFGVDENENNFELMLGKSEPVLEDGAFIYIEGSEYGGIVGGMKSDTAHETRTNTGRTWHGVLESKIIQPDPGADYYIVSGEAHEVLRALITRLSLSELFFVRSASSGVIIDRYQFARYIKAYKGIRTMLTQSGAKLKMNWTGGRVELYVEPVVDYTTRPVDGDEAALSVERYGDKVNHLVCLGAGDLAAREVLHLYVDQFGRIGKTQFFTGLAEVMDVYDYGSVSSSEQLYTEGVKHFEEIRNRDSVTVTAYEGSGIEYDIGDIIGGTDNTTGNTAKATVVQKIVKINNGAIRVEYKTGG